MKKDIPTHDPQTGDLNPYYEELTGDTNPLRIHVSQIEDQQVSIDKLLEYIEVQIVNSTKISDDSNDPSFWLGRIDALLEIRRRILKNDFEI